ncbi:MAG: ABC transporter substrate-binding protein, partial [Sciscionella sp.]
MVAVTAAGCGGGSSGADGIPSSITIAYQPGISYAPLLIVKSEKMLEKKYPKTTFTWKVLSSGAPIRDGMISGDIQVGAGGVGPLILGWAKGVDWRYLASMNDADLWLMAKSSKYRTLQDYKKYGGKIAMPSPTSIQSVVLRKAAAEK